MTTNNEAKAKSCPEGEECYFSHIPHKFIRKKMVKYCGLFGKPSLKLNAFVEFLHKEVAEETMYNPLMFSSCVEPQYVHPERRWAFFKETDESEESAILRRRKSLLAYIRNLNRDEVEKWKKWTLAKVKHKMRITSGVDPELLKILQ